MSRKRPGFEIFPEDGPAGQEPPADLPPAAPARPGPMASAIAETAGSLGARAGAEADIRAENDAIAHEHMRLVRLGLVAEPVPLAAIRTTRLIRDRSPGEDTELGELVESIRALGLSNPIRLERAAGGATGGAAGGAGEGFELIQGFRRLAAYRLLLAETGDEARWGAIPALVGEPGETLEMLYRRMIDENLVRRGVSFAELARLAIDYALDPASGVVNADQAVALLYRSASYQKRSHIRGFLPLMAELGDVLHHAGQIPRALGQEVSTALLEQPDLAPAIRAELARLRPHSAAGEMAILRRMAGEEDRALERASARRGHGRQAGGASSAAAPTPAAWEKGQPTARTGALRLDLEHEGSPARVIVAPGRIEILTGEDFTTRDPATLRQAVAALLARLE